MILLLLWYRLAIYHVITYRNIQIHQYTRDTSSIGVKSNILCGQNNLRAELVYALVSLNFLFIFQVTCSGWYTVVLCECGSVFYWKSNGLGLDEQNRARLRKGWTGSIDAAKSAEHYTEEWVM